MGMALDDEKSPPPKKAKRQPELNQTKKDKQYTIKSKDFDKFADMKASPKAAAASDDEKSVDKQDKHELFLKSLSASINSYSLKEASNASADSSDKASPKKIKANRISDVSAEL